jgi:molybdopterin-containing oxidoreductase family iron-sulfur binding subunit
MTRMPSHAHIPIHALAAQPAELTPALSRRDAMRLMAASMALAGAGCSRAPEHRIHPYVDLPEAGVDGMPIHYASACVREGYAQGVLIATREGRPIKVEGNPSHPSSLGATDVFAQASVLQLWDPDRSQGVWQRLDGTAPGAAPSTWAAFRAAWRAQADRWSRDGGAGLRVLSAPHSSPLLQAQLDALLQRWPRARWHCHGPLAPTSSLAGARAAFDRALRWVWHFDRARFTLALDIDPFSQGAGSVRHARDWWQARAATRAAGPMMMAAETAPSLFGVRADERVALAPSAIEAMLWRIASRLHGDVPVPSGDAVTDERTSRFEAHALAQLRRHGADSLMIAGDALSPQAHALVHLLNQRQGAFGRTLDAIDPLPCDSAGSLRELTEAMRSGAVQALLILGGNPAYDASPDVAFGAALARVPFSAHCSLYRDETSVLCGWHLPASHDHEQWSDALAHDGTPTLLQPAIAPLYDTRSPHELLALLLDDPVQHGHGLLQRHWRTTTGTTQRDFDAFWRDSLRHGVVQAAPRPPLQLSAARVPRAPVPSTLAAGQVEPVFVADASTLDGRWANNGWLQELPRPFTKLTWGNALHLGPATAAALGVRTGDIVRLSAAGASLDAPVWVQRGHAEHAATLPLGHGRWRAGRVGNGVGFDAYRLRTSQPDAYLQIERTGRQHAFAVRQHEFAQHGRELARTVPIGAARIEAAPQPSLYPAWPEGEHAWAMTIDLDACIGCNACTIACQAENNIPVVGAQEVARGRAMHWIRVDRYDDADVHSLFQPVPCMHCEHAPCELVCPVGATVHDSDGLNVQVYNRCIGTRFCSNNCPYKVRRFNFLQYADTTTETFKAMRNPDVTVRQRGVMEKCTYCLQRLTRARLHAETSGRPLRDGDVLTACQAVCPTTAIRFGDLRDPQSDVRRAKASPRHYALLDELNTRPRTTYLARRVAGREDTT